MKKNVSLVIVLAVVLLVAVSFVRGNSDEDYKVIKNAVKVQNASGEVSWFRLEVTDKKANKTEVKLKIPIALVDLAINAMDDEIKTNHEKGQKCDIDIHKLLNVLRSSGPTSLIEVEDEDSVVKIWFE